MHNQLRKPNKKANNLNNIKSSSWRSRFVSLLNGDDRIPIENLELTILSDTEDVLNSDNTSSKS